MITPAQHAEIRRLYCAEHWKIGTIAVQLGVHHETVAAARHRASVLTRGGRCRSTALDPFLPFLRDTLDTAARPRLRPRTLLGYKQHIEQHIIPESGRVRLRQLSPHHVQTLVARKSEEGLAPRTISYMREVLRTALNKALQWRLIPTNPAALVDLPRASKHEFRIFTPEEARRFLTSTHSNRLGPLFSVALALGIRLGRRSDSSGRMWIWMRSPLRVRQALQRIERKSQLVEPKSDRSRRAIVLPDVTVRVLRQHRASQLRERLIAGR